MTNEATLPPNVEQYLGAVREHLALRGVPAATVGAQIQELKNHLVDSGADPVAEFGWPDTYAEQVADAIDTPGWVRWARPALAYISTALLMLGITVIAGGPVAPGGPLRHCVG